VHLQAPGLDTFEDWQPGPPLGHSTMITDPRTQAIAKQYLLDGLAEKSAAAARTQERPSAPLPAAAPLIAAL
jgi:hypothetical protein